MKDPISPDNQKAISHFQFMGAFVAKAMLDGRLVDLNFSNAFLKTICSNKLDFEDLKEIDPSIGNSLEKLIALLKQKEEIENDKSKSPQQKQDLISKLTMEKGVRVEQLDLDFTMPGDSSWELKPNGTDIPVTLENLREYVNLVVETYLVHGVSAQINAFKFGFDQVFPISNLISLSVEEISILICGEREDDWSLNTLIENTKCDHGFSHNSPVVQFLLQTMTEFNAEEKRKFLLFVTGSPVLPIGGFKSLQPKLTIVRKEEKYPDKIFPSVNCCFYYFKLPEYSSKDILKQQLTFAMINGQGCFSFN